MCVQAHSGASFRLPNGFLLYWILQVQEHKRGATEKAALPSDPCLFFGISPKRSCYHRPHCAEDSGMHGEGTQCGPGPNVRRPDSGALPLPLPVHGHAAQRTCSHHAR